MKEPDPSKAVDRIRYVHIPLVVKRFVEAATDYNSDGALPFEPHTVLGIKGQFADVWRKVWKLKKALWDGAELKGEQPIEIIDDLIAHLFLTRDLITQEVPEPGTLRETQPDSLSLVVGDATPADVGKVGVEFRTCGPQCSPRKHIFTGQCRYRLAGDWLAPTEGDDA